MTSTRERTTGYDDLPRNGAFVLGGMANHGAALGDLVKQLGVSKQAISQLIDTLVLRGYLERHPDEDASACFSSPDMSAMSRGSSSYPVVRSLVVVMTPSDKFKFT